MLERINNYGHHPSIVAWCIGGDWDLTNANILYDAAVLRNAVTALDTSRLYFLNNDVAGARSKFYPWYSSAGMETPIDDLKGFGTNKSYATVITSALRGTTSRNPKQSFFVADSNTAIGEALRSVGHSYDVSEDLGYQAAAAKELVEIARRGRTSSNSLRGIMIDSALFDFDNYAWSYNIKEPAAATTPKPIIDALTSAFEPIHASIEVLSPNVKAGTTLTATVYVLNDNSTVASFDVDTLDVALVDGAGGVVATATGSPFLAIPNVAYFGTATQAVSIAVPSGIEGKYAVQATLKKVGDVNVVSVNTKPVSIVPAAAVVNKTTAVKVYPSGSVAAFTALGVNATTAASKAVADIIVGQSVSTSDVTGRNVLVIEPTALTGFGGITITIAGVGEDFVNIERDGIVDKGIMRVWNNLGTVAVPNMNLFDDYLSLTASDVDDVAILGNAGVFLTKVVLADYVSGSNHCIISTVDVIDRLDPKSDLYLAQLVDYYLANKAGGFDQYVEVGPVVGMGNYKNERGLFSAELLQGMIVEDDNTGDALRASRELMGEMQLVAAPAIGEGPIEAVTPAATTATATLEMTCVVDVDEVVVDVANLDNLVSKSITVTVNGTSSGVVAVAADSEAEVTVTLPSTITAGSVITVVISGDLGLRVSEITLADPKGADMNGDGIVNFEDYAIMMEKYGMTIQEAWEL